MSDHSTPTSSHSRINGHADVNKIVHAGGDEILVIDSDGKYFISAETMTEAVFFGESLGDDLGAYVQVSVPVGTSVVDFAHSLGY